MLILDIDATEDDIKDRYRKLSSLVHPDKSRDPRARDAFLGASAAVAIFCQAKCAHLAWAQR